MPGGILLVVALAIAGAFGGLAGAIMLQGEQYYLKTGFSSGYGFDGLVVGLLSRGSTLGVLVGRAVLRLPALGRHLHGDHGGRAGRADAGHPGPDRHRRRRLGHPGREAPGEAADGRDARHLHRLDASARHAADAGGERRARVGARRRAQPQPRRHDADGRLLRRAGLVGTGDPYLGVACAILAVACRRGGCRPGSASICAPTSSWSASASTSWRSAPRPCSTASSSAACRARRSPAFPSPAPGLSDLPFGAAFFQQSVIVYVGLALIALAAMLNHTSFGLAVRAVGDEPRSGDKAGIPVPQAARRC